MQAASGSTCGLPPGPPCRFGYANPDPFVRDRLGTLRALVRDHGDCSRFHLGFREVFFLNHPDDVRRLLVSEQRKLRRSAVTQLTRFVLGTSVFNAEGEAHRQQRRRMAPAMQGARVATYAGLMAATAHAHQLPWRSGDRIDASVVARRIALEIGSKALFGIDLGPEAVAIDRSMRALFGAINRMDHPRDWIGWALPLPENLRTLQAVRTLDAIAWRTVASARRDPSCARTLLGSLLRTHDEGEISLRQVRDEVALTMIAGHETTAQALTWALDLIARHADVQERLHAEIDRVLGGDTPGWESVGQLPYLERVVREVMRLYPPSPIFDRYTCSPLEFAGFRIPAGRTVFVSPFVTQRDARFFAAPERFNPDRWGPGIGEAAHHAYFPFGAGPRRCIGEVLVTTEMTLVLAVLLQSWSIRAEGAAPIEPEALVTLRPKGDVQLWVQRRHKSSSKEGAQHAGPRAAL